MSPIEQRKNSVPRQSILKARPSLVTTKKKKPLNQHLSIKSTNQKSQSKLTPKPNPLLLFSDIKKRKDSQQSQLVPPSAQKKTTSSLLRISQNK